MSLRKRVKALVYGRVPGFKGAFPYFGSRVYFPKGSVAFRAACDQGIYEADNIRLINSLTRPATTVLDVGANIGLMAVPVLNANPNARVTSFEASPNVIPFLARTIAESPYAGRWTLVPMAVGATEGHTEFNLSSMANSMFDGIKATNRVPSARRTEVEMTTIDSWWKGAGRPEVSVIKLDVEGGEMPALEGARECLSIQRPHILLEWNRANLLAYGCNESALIEFSQECDYRVYAVPHLVPTHSASELRLQMGLTENFLLVPVSR